MPFLCRLSLFATVWFCKLIMIVLLNFASVKFARSRFSVNSRKKKNENEYKWGRPNVERRINMFHPSYIYPYFILLTILELISCGSQFEKAVATGKEKGTFDCWHSGGQHSDNQAFFLLPRKKRTTNRRLLRYFNTYAWRENPLAVDRQGPLLFSSFIHNREYKFLPVIPLLI